MTDASNSEAITSAMRALPSRIRSEANISDRPGQLGRLELIAAEVEALLMAASNSESPLSQPIPAPVDSGAIGRLNERQVGELRRLVHTCTYDRTLDQCAIDEADYDVADAVAEWHAAIVREHTDRALAEVEQRIEHGPHRLGHNVSVVCSCVRCEATHACLAIVRAARQEQGR